MRRTRRSVTTDPDELAALYAHAKAEAARMDPHAAAWHVRDTLAAAGADPLEALIARYWIRQGRPRTYRPAVLRGWIEGR